jgi:hypothetical protein
VDPAVTVLQHLSAVHLFLTVAAVVVVVVAATQQHAAQVAQVAVDKVAIQLESQLELPIQAVVAAAALEKVSRAVQAL